MFDRIIKLFIKDSDNLKSASVREAHGRLAGVMGIVCNVFLCALKLSVGMIFNSISVMADAVNNLSDALSSTIAAVSFKISNKPADEEHPYGHQRMEYVAGMLVSVMILFIGYELLRSSIDKIIHPDEMKFSYLTVAVLCVSIIVKLFMNRMYNFIGSKINSSVLKATAQDSINDVYSTSAVLVSVVVSGFTSLHLDGYMGAAVSLFIIFSGISLIKETLDPLLGTMPDEEFVKMVEDKILGYEGILGIHDLMVHNYGPDKIFATVHAEVSAGEDVLVSHDLIDNIERDFLKDNVNLVIHMDPVITNDDNVTNLKKQVKAVIESMGENLSFHDFRVVFGQSHTNLIFDVVVPYSCKYTAEQLTELIQTRVNETVGDNFYCVIAFDREYIKKR